jgi:hypothetical protein
MSEQVDSSSRADGVEAVESVQAAAKPKPVRRRAPAKASAPDAETSTAKSENDAQAVAPAERPTRRPPRRAAKTEVAPSVDSTSSEQIDASDISDAGSPSAERAPATEPRTIRQPPPLRRRVGGRRSIVEAANATSQEAVGSSELPEGEVAVPPSSRNRRRRAAKRPDQETPAVASATEAAGDERDDTPTELILETDVLTEPAATAEEERKRSRRSRRGGRRRSGRATDSESADETELEAGIVEYDETAEDVPVFSSPAPPWKAPRLVASAEGLGFTPVVVRSVATLSEDASGFDINGVYYGPELYFVNSETSENADIVSQQIRLAANTGIHLHSGVSYLPFKNAFGVRSFSSIQSLIKQTLDADPEGYIFVRLQCVPTNFWARTHPQELSLYADGSNGDVSFSSRAFWQDTVEAIEALIRFCADSETFGGDRVIGFHLDKGEWFNDANSGYDISQPNKLAFQEWLHEKYQTPYALRAAWFSGTAVFESAEIPKWPGSPTARKKEEVVLYSKPQDRRYVDYNAFTSDIMAQGITGVAEAIKWLSNSSLLVGASYGYTLEFSTRNDSGHQALSKVLRSPFIDIVAGPNTYSKRQAGEAGSFSSPVDSAKLNGKLWIVEDDTKTYLAADETDDAFNPKVVTSQDTISVLRRNASAAFVHGCGISWMDLWGNGWLNSQELWDEIAELRSQAVITRRLRENANQVPDVAVLVDEASYSFVCGDPTGIALQLGLIGKSRELIYRSGASVGFYLQSDVGLLPEGTRLFIFLNPLRVTSQERQAIREKLQKPGKTLAWVYAPGLFDENGGNPTEVSELVGMPLKAQPWNSRIGTIFTEERHPVTERLHGGKRLGTDEVLNPSYCVADPAAIILGEYAQSGAPSIAAKINEGGWKSVFIGEPHLTGELLRGLYRYAGIHVYDVQDDIVHACSSGVLLVHSPYTGQRTVHLPKPAAVYSLYEHRLVTQQSSTFRTFMRGRATNFFLWGDIEKIATSLGTTADALKEQHAAWKAERESNQQRNPRTQQQREDDAGESDTESDSDYGTPDIIGAADGGAELSEHEEAEVSTIITTVIPAVSALVESGLIAADTDILDGDFVDEDTEGSETASEPAPAKTESMSPSRRRRWNRKRNMQAAKNTAPPAISMEDLLSDLPPRKQSPPKAPEE